MVGKIEDAIEEIKQGRTIILIDDEDRENEGDLVCAAELVTTQQINFMITHGRGLVCLPLTEEKAVELDLAQMVRQNEDPHRTAFTVSIDAATKYGVTTGISASDRAKTIQLVMGNAKPDDLRRPGHVFPLVAKEGGVLRRAGHTEASVDLAKQAGLKPAAVICEIIKDNGEMARLPDLEEFAQKHQLNIYTIRDLIKYRAKRESLVERTSEVNMPTIHGVFKAIGFKEANGAEHIALIKGDISNGENVLTRVHSSCLTGDVFGSMRCDCGDQLSHALDMIEKEGRGVLLYMSQEGRGIGLINKLKAYKLQENGRDTVEANLDLGFKADLRDYGIGAQILQALGLKSLRLLTNNPRKIVGLEGYGIKVLERMELQIEPGQYNKTYLNTKKSKLGHYLHE